MRYLSSRPFVVGLLLMVGGILSMPLFVTALAGGSCSTPSPANPSWDCFQPTVWDFRIPVVLGASGFALILVAVVRMRRVN